MTSTAATASPPSPSQNHRGAAETPPEAGALDPVTVRLEVACALSPAESFTQTSYLGPLRSEDPRPRRLMAPSGLGPSDACRRG